MAWEAVRLIFILWILFLIMVEEINAATYPSIIKSPQLNLKVGVTPKRGAVAGDTVVYSLEMSHSKRSFASAIDVELRIISPVFLVVGSHTIRIGSLQPDDVTKSAQGVVFKFSNISTTNHVMVTLDIHVDPYYMLGSREEMTTSSAVHLWYYGEFDSCDRPANKWNARSTSRDIRFTFLASKVCERLLGPLYESQFSASSFDKPNFNSLGNAPHHASFQYDKVWSPAQAMKEDVHQYLQIELDQLTTITKIATKGNGKMDPPSFVKSYVVHHSRDEIRWSLASTTFKSTEFQGNSDSMTMEANYVNVPFEAKFLRIVPKTWKNEIALKVMLFGCRVYQVPAGHQPLGISSGHVSDSQISVESGNKIKYPPYNVRLNLNRSPGGWCTTQSWGQTLVIDLGKDHFITKLAVQSKFQAANKLIKAFYLAYKNDGGVKTYIRENNEKKLFLGNPVEDTTIRHKLLEVIKARYTYIEPNQLSNTGCLRIELYGYEGGEVPSADYCNIIDFENGGLNEWTVTGSAFENQPTFHDNLLPRTGHVINNEGAWWIGTREDRKTPYTIAGETQGNHPTGTLTSPPFLISFSKLFFLFAGSSDPEKARVELIIDGRVVRSGFSETGNESMVQMSWDVKDLIGSEGTIRLMDNATDGFVSFDGLKANCDPSEEQLEVLERSFLLSSTNNTLYICQLSHTSDPQSTVCRFTTDNGESWKDLPRYVSGLLGIQESSGKLYGVSKDFKNYLESADWSGRSWKPIKSSVWESIKNDVTLTKVVEIPHLPVTGLPETDEPSSVLTMTANSGDAFGASSLGVHHKPSGGSWEMIASWYCQEYSSACISNPCNNGGTCQELDGGGFNCTCAKGFTGEICDSEIDDCQVDSCLNGGQCFDLHNNFFCLCKSFFTGPRCERNIDDCINSPCSEGALCIDGLGNFTCQCPKGYIGEKCELEIDECASVPCQHGGLCIDEVDSFKCHCRRGYTGENCEDVLSSAFEVISSRSVQYGVNRYLVVHARLPLDGHSLHQTWCHDYQSLCDTLNKTRPTGCGRSLNHIADNQQCLTTFDSVMDHDDSLGCPPSIKVSSIARMAGYGGATLNNSFAFSHCSGSGCTNVLPQSGCHGALSCISQGVLNREVYTLCSYSDSNFVVEDKTHASFKGVDYLALYVRPINLTARYENWCRDYQRLCQSYGKRPTGCGETYSSESHYLECQKEYFSVMASTDEPSCEDSAFEAIGKSAGLPSTTHRFIFHNCSASGCQKELPSCGGLKCLNESSVAYHALCTQPKTSFTVLDERRTVLKNVSLVVIKAKLPNNRESTQENWCRDYFTLCDSYGLRPTGCRVPYDHEYTSCRDNYGSVTFSEDLFGCPPDVKVAELAKQVGFSAATPFNSFALNKCTECSPILHTTNCAEKGLGCVNPTKNNDVYTVCVEPHTGFDILETKSAVYNYTAYLVVKARLPKSGESKFKNWSVEYEQLCLRYGRRTIKCGNVTSTNPSNSSMVLPSIQGVCIDGQPDEDTLKTIAQKAGFPDASNTNTLHHCFTNESHVIQNDGVVYILCHGADSNFDVISTKIAQEYGRTYLVIKAQLPSHGLSRYENWCEDYKRLCYSYGQRPTGCGGESYTAISSYTACRDIYDSLMPKDNTLGCPLNYVIKSLANLVGFPGATINNTFAFSFCNDLCEKNISEKGRFISSVNLNGPVYTVCSDSNSSFNVESTKDVSYQGGNYKVIKARIPSHMKSKHKNWCEDYREVCESYGMRAIVTSKASDFTCERNYRAIATSRNEINAPEKLAHVVEMAGYLNSIPGNIFAFNKNCQDSCFADLVDFNSVQEPALSLDSSVVSNQTHVVYALCMNSDSNFDVVDRRNIVYENRSYLVLKMRIPVSAVSKFDNWCVDYQRLCAGYEMRPVTVLQTNSADDNLTTCISDYMSVVVPSNKSLHLLAREHVSMIASHSGYSESSRDNSFAFRQCNPKHCPRVLTTKCSSGLDCLTNLHREVYTLCADSDSNFVVEQTRHIQYQGIPYLLIQSRIPQHGLARHENWCFDYQRLCKSFGMQPTGCGSSWNNSRNSRCFVDYQSFMSPVDQIRCGDEAVDILKEMSDQALFENETVFVFQDCEFCSRKILTSCDDTQYCLRKSTSAVTVCTALESHFKVLEIIQSEYNGQNLTIAKTRLTSNGSSYHENWCQDYNKMCSSLGKRPFSCGFPGDVAQYESREQYNTFLSNTGLCPSTEVLISLVSQAGFPLATQENVLAFINCTACSKELKYDISCSEVVDVVGELVNPVINPKTCCKCSNTTTVDSNNTLVTTLLTNSSFSSSWKGCVIATLNQTLNKTLGENCSLARDCLNNTVLANNSCELLSKCFYGNCFNCCACNYTRHVCSSQILMRECSLGRNCSDLGPKINQEVYTICSDYSDSHFEVQETRKVEFDGLPYAVVRAQIPSHGYSKSASWCEDYRKLCESMGKRPIGCGKDAEVLKSSRECRLKYDAVMIEGMSCPASKELTDVAMHAGFPVGANQSLGLWSCDRCSSNFSDVWNATDISSDVYAVCYDSDSNFHVLEKRVVQFHGTSVTVLMAKVPDHGLSLHENWCRDYMQLCQSYGQRPVGCGKSRDNNSEHAQCRVQYNALMFSDDSIDCLESFNVHSIAQLAGFRQATPRNSLMFHSCQSHCCSKFLPSSDAIKYTPGQFILNSTNRVVYTVCASSDSAYEVLATKLVTKEHQDYLVVRAKIPNDGISKYDNWCQDYQKLCEGYGMRPLSCKHSDYRQRMCMYSYQPLTMTDGSHSCPTTSGVASIAKEVGFDEVSSSNSFAFDYCDTTSCVAKIPNIFCWNETTIHSVFTNITKEANITLVDFVSLNFTNATGNGTDVGNSTDGGYRGGYCLVLPDTISPLYVNGVEIGVLLKNFTCVEEFDSQSPGVNISFFNMTVNQTIENLVPRVTRLCRYNSPSSLARVSGEVNTVCLAPNVGKNFEVESTRNIIASGREYVIIKSKLLSSASNSQNWCTDYKNLCQSFGASPLACPRGFHLSLDHLKCGTNYEAIMMSDVDYSCPSNGFIQQLAQAAGYQEAVPSNSFALFDCHDDECQSRLPLTGCSKSLPCLNEQVLNRHVYTACVVKNSDSNFHVIEKRETSFNGKKYTVIRSRIPTDGKSLHDTWCMDYQRLCESLDLRPVHCESGVSEKESDFCKEKYNAISVQNKGCPVKVHELASKAGFSGTNSLNSFSFYRCNSCSRTLTSTCSEGLRCLKSRVGMNEVYTVCGNTETETNFVPLATKHTRHGNFQFRVIQAKLRSKHSAKSDWGRDYENLCKSYNRMPTGCGHPSAEKDPGVFSCSEKYSSHLLPGGELQCNPNAVISKLARDVGFINALPNNSFGFSSCNGSSRAVLTSSCHSNLPCLTWQDHDPVVYTVCVKTIPVSNFRVLSTKLVNFHQSNYLVVHAQLPSDGRSLQANWCFDYQQLCGSYGMRPTGCGGSSVLQSDYSSCSSTYGSYMPGGNYLGCGNSIVASRIANKAGYINSIPDNTFVFHNCHKCSAVLANSTQCDGALVCINNMAWKREVYTLCVDPTTNFNVAKTLSVEYSGTKYLVVEASLPSDGRPKSENWCREYEMLCDSYKKRPVSCYKNANDWQCAKKYNSIAQPNFSCDSGSLEASKIAINAGFDLANADNSFILHDCDPESCSKDLPATGCGKGFPCINSNVPGNVYAICLEVESVFELLDSKKLALSGAVYTFVSALLPHGMYNTWCQDYSALCHSIGHSPVVLPTDIIREDVLRCRDEFDGVILPEDIQDFENYGVHHLAIRAGYNGARYGNAFAFKGCSHQSCAARPSAFNCSHSLHCLNGDAKDRTVYALCVEETPVTNFYVLDTRTVNTNDTTFLFLKVRLPVHRLSKYESWCRDYQHLCRFYNMRPLSSVTSLSCQLDYHAILNTDYSHHTVVDIFHEAGFFNASSKNLYFLQQCGTEECGRKFQFPQCTAGSCISEANQSRELYTLCISSDERFATNFEVQDVRNVWLNASFLAARVKLPSHRMSKNENWCKEYQTFCESYGRRPYNSAGLSKKNTFENGACYWKYNATSYRVPIASLAIAQQAGFNPSSEHCVSSLYRCFLCGKQLGNVNCPLENCQDTVQKCLNYYIICT